jgi:hypothetical protein
MTDVSGFSYGRTAFICSNKFRISGIMGTIRVSLFLVPVCGSPRTMISPRLKLQSAQVMNLDSLILNPPKARNWTSNGR